MIRILRSLAAFTSRDIAIGLSYRVAAILGFLSTIVRVLVMWLPAQLLADSRLFSQHGGFLAYSIIGTSMMSIFMASYGGFAGAIRAEQAMGTLEAVLMTPSSTTVIVVGSNLWAMCCAVFDAVLMLITGVLAFHLGFKGSWIAAVGVVVLTNCSFAAIGIISAAFSVVFKRGDPFRIVVSMASFLIGGVLYPVEVLPHWVQQLSALLPVTHGARALRGILLDGAAPSKFASEIGILAGYAIVGIPLSIACFAWAIRQAKRDGSLLQF